MCGMNTISAVTMNTWVNRNPRSVKMEAITRIPVSLKLVRIGERSWQREYIVESVIPVKHGCFIELAFAIVRVMEVHDVDGH